ncbi:LysR family transcriptional regulator [Saccharopolyspora karakumensis]|uniref:LysR family transcriptional regulator n=1 Tax=Saccharopolyspora karakumensis TaxID=2530386 RepID=A0A4R5C330_9PSEU|nr:LysR family transcriptional regulator [Saccharopolyspora karakumensis]TDD92766.1 LysR family transcriptional regulator [Saccharopolyspora karakumensis]
MDLVGGCRAFVSVSEFGGFTGGAAAIGIPQPVASRRIAALEKHLGERLFDRSTHRAQLTPFGRSMLPWAQRLVNLADAMERDADRARLRPIAVAVPTTCRRRDLAELDSEARAHELFLQFRPARPAQRFELVRGGEVRVALTAAPSDEATWTVPLGVASAVSLRNAAVHLEALRIGRAAKAPKRRVWIQPEDDVPHIRDPLMHLRDRLGLQPAQVSVAESLTSAAATCFGSADLLLCSAAQAEEFGLHWHRLVGISLDRGYEITADTGDEAERFRVKLWNPVARCLGGGAR